MYLQKFYHIVLSLPENKTTEYPSTVEQYMEKIFKILPLDGVDDSYLANLIKIISHYARHENITLRTLERVATRAGVFLALTDKMYASISPVVATLCLMKVVNPPLYQKAKNRNISLAEISEFMKFDKSETIKKFCEGWWGLCVGDKNYYESNNVVMEELSRTIPTLFVPGRETIIPKICGIMDNLTLLSG